MRSPLVPREKIVDKAELVPPEEDRYNPYPRLYEVPLQQAFTAVRDVLGESLYNVSDKWREVMADTERQRITAGLPINPKYSDQKKYLGLAVDFHDTDNGATLIELKFDPRDSVLHVSSNYIVHDKHVSECLYQFMSDIGQRLGPATIMSPPKVARTTYKYEFVPLPPPSWSLLGVTGFGIILLVLDFVARLI